MFIHQLRFEWKSLLRSRWLPLLSVLLIALCWYAAGNGKTRVDKRRADLSKAKAEVVEGDSMALLLIDSLERGLQVSVPAWRLPNQPTILGSYYPRLAAMPIAPLALSATGQSDLFVHYVRPRIYGDDYLLNYTEMVNPVQLLFGSFDLAFVFVFLLPLVIIAFSYDLLSSEREQGSLRLLAAQPLTLAGWLFRRVAVRFSVIAVLVVVATAVGLAFNGVNLSANGPDFFRILLLVLAYAAFWFLLAFLTNLAGGSSAYNAVAMLGAWVVFVLLLPAIASQSAHSLFPIPSRAKMVNDLRVVENEAEKEAQKLLDDYYRTHPELLPADSTKKAEAIGWKEYFASLELVKKEMAPVVAAYEQQIAGQRRWTENFRFASPAILLQDGLLEIAGQSSRHYEAYRRQVSAFTDEWRNFFIPLIFQGEKAGKQTFAQLPAFVFRESEVKKQYAGNLFGILLFSGLLAAGALLRFSRRPVERLVSGV